MALEKEDSNGNGWWIRLWVARELDSSAAAAHLEYRLGWELED